MPTRIYTEVTLRFDLFLSLYAAFPDSWVCGDERIEFVPDNNTVPLTVYEVKFETRRDRRKYEKWYRNKRQNDEKRKADEAKRAFFSDLIPMYGGEIMVTTNADDQITTFDVGEPEVIVGSIASSYKCNSCSGTFIYIDGIGAIRQRVDYCPLCGRKRR